MENYKRIFEKDNKFLTQKKEQVLVHTCSLNEEKINSLETTIKELSEKLLETKLIYETCLADLDEKDRIIAEKTVILLKLNQNTLKVLISVSRRLKN